MFDNSEEMKKIIIILVVSLMSNVLFPQSNVRLTNDWSNTYIINPGAINDLFLTEFNMAYRKQWVGFKGAPETLFASTTLYLDDLSTQFGLKLLQDKVGFTSTTDIDFTYAYSLMLNRDWRLNMGLGLSFQSLAYDVSKISSPTPSDPIVLSVLSNESYINSDMGVEFTSKFFRFGLASQNVFSLFSNSNNLFPNTNFFYAMYHDRRHDYFSVGYGVCEVQYLAMYQTECNLTGYFKASSDNEPIQLSLVYRTWNEAGVLFGIDINRNLRVSYSYDYDFGDVKKGSTGTHEFMITYRFDKNPKCRHCWY